MRVRDRKTILVVLAAMAAILYLGCNDSNDVTSPGPMVNAANVSGDWSGTYTSDSAALCVSASAAAQLSQQGSVVTGSFRVPGCGIGGTFRGTINGSSLTGSVNMAGCTGGAVSGRLDASGITFIVGDFTKTLITGDREVMPGGTANLQR